MSYFDPDNRFAMPPPRSGEGFRRVVVLTVTVVVMVIAVASFTPALVPGPVARALGIGARPLGQPPTVGGTGAFRFLATQRSDKSRPVAYDPCREIHVVFNPVQAPSGAQELVTGAMQVVGAATGLRFVFDGTSTDRPRWQGPTTPMGLSRSAPVLVSFATATEVPQLAGRVAGVGGSTLETNRFGESRYVTGQVTLDSMAFAVVLGRPEGRAEARAIVLHEFGHLVGLDHVDDPTQLMYADNVGRLDFGNGDRRGLAALGRGDCF